MVPDTHFGHILCPVDKMFQIYDHQGEPEPEDKVGSPHTTILDLSTIVPPYPLCETDFVSISIALVSFSLWAFLPCLPCRARVLLIHFLVEHQNFAA